MLLLLRQNLGANALLGKAFTKSNKATRATTGPSVTASGTVTKGGAAKPS